jgi:signal transduction histidine kinase
VRVAAAYANNALLLAAAASVALRFRRSQGDARRQLLWMAVSAVALFGCVIVAFAAAASGHDAVLNVAAAGMVAAPSVGAGLAVSRYRLYDVDRILSRALSYLVASMLMAVAFLVVVLIAARAIGEAADRSPTASALATLAVVVAVRPVHAAVQDVVDRRFARRRHDAARQIRAYIDDPTSQPSVEAALRVALADPDLRVAYPVGSDDWVTEDGRPVRPEDAQLVTRGGRTVAAVTCAGEPNFVRSVLEVAAPELDTAGLRAAVALQLHEVVGSRLRIAQAQIDERRRIERDLHDGAQQRLLGAAAQLQAALLNGEPARMREALELGMAECRAAVLELRELANGLHPAALADGGLAPAIEDLARRFPITTVIDVSDHRYQPHLESTLWFVTCEALANAVKHAQPALVEVRLAECEGELRLTIDDDGCGTADPQGRGLRGLADRVEAIGGRLVVSAHSAGGTRVEAVVPCAS